MKRIICTLSIALGLGLSANAQIESLAGPRLGAVYMTASPASNFLNGTLKLDELGELPENYDDITKGLAILCTPAKKVCTNNKCVFTIL